MRGLRSFTKRAIVLVLGAEVRPHRILRGLASGYRIFVSPEQNLGYLFGTVEPHLQRILRQYVRAGDTVYDVGANLGYVTLSMAGRVGKLGKVIAFEPVPSTASLLRQTITLNQLSNVEVVEIAASASAGEAIIRVPRSHAMASLIWHKGDAGAVEIRVETAPIDLLVSTKSLPQPNFVKIDVEGAEGMVLNGMRSTLESARPILFMECSEAGREIAWNLLHELGYHCQSALTRESIREFDQYRHSDFLWLPGPEQDAN